MGDVQKTEQADGEQAYGADDTAYTVLLRYLVLAPCALREDYDEGISHTSASLARVQLTLVLEVRADSRVRHRLRDGLLVRGCVRVAVVVLLLHGE